MLVSKIKITGKYLDQPLLTAKFSKAMPAVLCGGAALITGINTYKAPPSEKNKVFIQNICVMIGTVASAIIAAKGLKPLKINGKEIFKGFKGLMEQISPAEVKKNQTKIVDEFLRNNSYDKNTELILKKSKQEVLNHSEISILYKNMENTGTGKIFLHKFIPETKTVNSKEIYTEIGKLSLMGLVPVFGGITGGIIGDKITDKKWKDKIPNKIKEGTYQYFANIFLCNVGAALALSLMEKMKIKSKVARAAGMTGGIVAMGILGGSAMANFIGKKFIDPILGKNKNPEHGKKNHLNDKSLYSERTPELLDVGLHVDDISTVAVISGLNWIAPTLPVLYSVSGYRAGIGYRNKD